ncbi:MAG TPA: hypothetical protein VLJ59_06765 [Mycobacteriales bacterium]|nr:hypothetical protein [Mycobacteriales bacterium]
MTRTSDVVDAIVVAVATELGATIVTSDPDDLAALAAAAGSHRPELIIV